MGNFTNSLVEGATAPLANWAIESIKERLEKVEKSPGLSSHESAVLQHKFVPDAGQEEKLVALGGLDDVLAELEEQVVHPMIYAKELSAYSNLLSPASGLLLYGPTGTGKSSIVRMLAYNLRNSGFALLNIPAGLVQQKYIGEGEKMVEAVFSVARMLAPCMIFIDEVDAVCADRESSHSNSATLKSALLTAWDGLSAVDADGQRNPILFIGATNRKEAIDPAFLRRFTVQKHVGLPDLQQREDILRLCLEKTRVATTFDFRRLASSMDGLSGSLIKDSCRDAAVQATRGVLFGAVNDFDHKQMDETLAEEKKEVARRSAMRKAVEDALYALPPLTVEDFFARGTLVQPSASELASQSGPVSKHDWPIFKIAWAVVVLLLSLVLRSNYRTSTARQSTMRVVPNRAGASVAM
ncbi:hypothetical protein LTR62_000741 [Meristemomyces frigidus]|uniref:AAA+ ATPase domain-containing protein n=1 Tax=Meristemomyces frigidus TaxID=1508187 RepID=A0AAN7T8K6_9PEZI|nr:hypothetical protein LTR62_000741 [Meristemomyces frigidus]